MHTRSLFHGPIISPVYRDCAKYLPRALLYVEAGTIKWIEEDVASQSRLEEVLSERGVQDLQVRKLRMGEFLIPGFIDTHTHAPQFENLGSGGQLQLLDWLEQYTYPIESRFGDEHHAKNIYSRVVRRLLDCGTTTCCYFTAPQLVGNERLADIVKAIGQRGFIGKCNMNRKIVVPDNLRDPSTQDSLDSTHCLIKYIEQLDCPRVQPTLTPRFAIACTEDLLKGLGDIAAAKKSLLIQTHIAENLDENKEIARLFPKYPTYASVYDRTGLLRPTTILAHGCHLSPEEVALIKERGAGLSHCPTSNFHLTSGIAKVGEWLDAGVKVGLGTDMAGGFSLSMLTAINHASIASKILAMKAKSPSPDVPKKCFANNPLPTATLLHMATLGGAELCNLEKRTGSFECEKAFDAILVNLLPEAGNPNVWLRDGKLNGLAEDAGVDSADLEALLEVLFFCGDDRNISAVWVEGDLVGGREFHHVKR